MKIQLKQVVWGAFLIGYKTKAGSPLDEAEMKIVKEKFKEFWELIKN